MGRKQKQHRGASIAAQIVMGQWQGGHIPGSAPFVENCQRLARAFPRAKANANREALVRLLTVVETRSRLLDEKISGRHRMVPTLLELGRLSPRWVREPEDWAVCPARPLRSERATVRRVTVRLDPTLRVVEARCFANAHPGDAEKRVIERWAAQNRLDLDWRSVR